MEMESELCGQRLLTAAKQPHPTSKTQLLLGEPSRHAEALSLEPSLPANHLLRQRPNRFKEGQECRTERLLEMHGTVP